MSAIPMPKSTPWERNSSYASSSCVSETIIIANTQTTEPSGIRTCTRHAISSSSQFHPLTYMTCSTTPDRHTEVPYASKVLPVSGPNPYKKNTCNEPMSEIDADDEDGSSVDS